MKLSKKRLLVIGGNNVIDEISRFAKNNGVILISASNTKSSNIHTVSDEQYYVDVTDHDAMKELIRAKRIDGVFSCSSEEVVPHSIEYLSELGLPCYTTLPVWNTLMNKRHLKDTCDKYGIDTIPEYHVNQETLQIEDNLSYPVVVKPVDSGSSAGLTVCYNKGQLLPALSFAKRKSKSGNLLIEKFVDAPFYQLEVYLKSGTPHLGYTKERVFYPAIPSCAPQPFLDIYPSSYNDRIEKEFFAKFSKLLVDLGIHDGSVQIQGLITDQHVYAMDVAYRLSGGMDYRPVAKERGINIVEQYLAYSITGEWGGDFSRCDEPFEHIYVTICVGLKNGLIKQISGLDIIKELPYVYDVFQYYQEGDKMTESGRFKQTLCRIFIQEKDKVTAMGRVSQVMNRITVTDGNGGSLLLNYYL